MLRDPLVTVKAREKSAEAVSNPNALLTEIHWALAGTSSLKYLFVLQAKQRSYRSSLKCLSVSK